MSRVRFWTTQKMNVESFDMTGVPQSTKNFLVRNEGMIGSFVNDNFVSVCDPKNQLATDDGENLLNSFFQFDQEDESHHNKNITLEATVSASKRAYLADLKPFTDVFTFNSIGMVILQAATLASFPAMNQYNQFQLEQLKRQEEGIEDYEDEAEFDYDEAIESTLKRFNHEVTRLFCIKLIKRCLFEEIIVNSFSSKLADRFTKDVGLSLTRKLHKMSRFSATLKIIKTSLWGNLTGYFTFWLVDSVVAVYSPLSKFIQIWSTEGLSEGLKFLRKAKMELIIGQKLLGCTTSWIVTSIGYGVGSYIHTTKGGYWVSSILDLVVRLIIPF